MGRKSKAAEHPEYEVEELKEFRYNRGKKEYLVKWKGFGEDQCSWEPEENMENAVEALEAFAEKHKDELAAAPPSNLKRGSHKLPAAESGSRRSSMKDGDGSSETNGSGKRVGKRLAGNSADDTTSESDTNKRTRSEATNSSSSKVWHGSSSRGAPSDDVGSAADNGSTKRPARISFTSNKTPNAASSANAKPASSPANNNKSSTGNRTPAASTSLSATRGNHQQGSRRSIKPEPTANSSNTRTSRSSNQPAKTTRGAQQHQSPRSSSRAPDSKVLKSEDLKEYSGISVHTMQGTVEHSEVVMDSSSNFLMQVEYKLNEKNGKVLRFSLTFDEIKMMHDAVQELAALRATFSQTSTNELDSGAGKLHDTSLSQVDMEGDDELVGGGDVGDGEGGGAQRSSSRRSLSLAANRSGSAKRKEGPKTDIELEKASDGIFGDEIETTDDERSKRGESTSVQQKSESEDVDDADGGHLNGASNGTNAGADAKTTSRELNAENSLEADMLTNGHDAKSSDGGGKAVGTGKVAEFSEIDKKQSSSGNSLVSGGGEDVDDELIRGIETEAV